MSPNYQLAVTLAAAALDLIGMSDKRGKLHVPSSASMKKLLWLFSNPLRKTLKCVHLWMGMKSQRKQGIGEVLMFPRSRGHPGEFLNTKTPPGK